MQKNTCDNNVICNNNAENLVSIGSNNSSSPGLEKLSNVQHDSDQEILQANKCEDGDGATACKTKAQNLFNIYGNSESDLGSASTKSPISVVNTQGIDQENRCESGSDCNKEAVNSANISQTGASSVLTSLDEGKAGSTNRVTLHQLSEQQDKCSFDSTCSDSSSNSATFVVGADEGDKEIDQQINQENHCLFGSTCSNEGSTSATIDDSNADDIEVKQSIDQQNLCLHSSTCSNAGTVSGESGSNSQSNVCVRGSTCNNTGENNITTCVGSANCENSGTDTTVISRGENCNSGNPGTITTCANGRTFTQ